MGRIERRPSHAEWRLTGGVGGSRDRPHLRTVLAIVGRPRVASERTLAALAEDLAYWYASALDEPWQARSA